MSWCVGVQVCIKYTDLSAHPNTTVVLTGRRQGCVTATSCAASSGRRDRGTHIRGMVDPC